MKVSMNNIKVIVCLILLTISYQSKAQTVGYTYKALAAEGCSVKYSVAKQDRKLLSQSDIQFR